MTARRHEADILVLGWSLEAALAAALAARAGCKIMWIGACEPTVAVGNWRAQAGPSLLPSLGSAPTLARLLRDAGLLFDVQRIQNPVSLQYLGEKRRITLATDWLSAPGGEAGLQSLQEMAQVANELSSVEAGVGFFARRRVAQQRLSVEGRIVAPQGIVGEAARDLESIFGRTSRSLGSILQTTAAPTDLVGGTVALGHILLRKCAQLGARIFSPLTAPLKEFNATWNGIDGKLPTGESISAKAVILALDEAEFDRTIPPSPLSMKIRPRSGRPLLRLSFIVRWQGLPQPLGTLALVSGSLPMWVERRNADDHHDSISLFWRSDGTGLSDQSNRAREAFRSVAPFFDRHVVAASEVAAVPDHERESAYPEIALSRRVLAARGPVLELDGAEGAAVAGNALAARVIKLAAKKKEREAA